MKTSRGVDDVELSVVWTSQTKVTEMCGTGASKNLNNIALGIQIQNTLSNTK